MNDLHYFHRDWIKHADKTLDVDICIYGGTSAGVIAGVTAAKRGKSVVVLQPGKHLGGMTTGGLGWTDFGRKHVIGGASRDFYRRLGQHYGKEEEWQFEPHVATNVMHKLIADHQVDVRLCQYIASAQVESNRIISITMLGGLTVRAKVFIDAGYEGDLLAKAGVSHAIGRESNSVYGEELNGIQVREQHQFSHRVDPYVIEGDASSGLLPLIEAEDLSTKQGQGDKRVQAYNFRVCMTDDPALKMAWQRPAGFEPRLYVLAGRWFNGEMDRYNNPLIDWGGKPTKVPRKFDILANRTAGGFHKTDTNNHGPVSSDFIGANWDWPEADYETRERIFQRHVAYQKGLYWFIANDASIPQPFREAYAAWGLPKDEFVTTGHWPHQLYVREARRMVGDYGITEHDCRGGHVSDSVGMGSYTMDSHNCTRFVIVKDGQAWVLNDGDVQIPPTDPYPISYRAIVPRRGEAANLLVPVCFSASHIAYGSARMEPVFMVLGESTAIAAALCIDNRCAVHDLRYDALRGELVNAKQVLFTPDPDCRK